MLHTKLHLPLALLASWSFASQAAPVAKQLAGPPEEFAMMKVADPALSSINSKSAVIPVQFEQDQQGNWRWETDLPIDSQDFKFLLFSRDSKNWDIQMRDPVTNLMQSPKASQFKSINELKTESKNVQYGMESNKLPAKQYAFENMEQGNWTLSITTKDAENRDGYLLIGGDSDYRLNSYKSSGKQVVNNTIHFVAEGVINKQGRLIGKEKNDFGKGMFRRNSNLIDAAYLQVTNPDGEQSKHKMYDDGLHGDRLANDGFWGGDFTPENSGNYNVQIVAQGVNPEGAPFLRTTEHLLPVIEQTIGLGKRTPTITSIDGNRLTIDLGINNASDSLDNHYRIIGEVWGLDKNSKTKVPVSWISTIAGFKDGGLNVELDSRWIAKAGAQPPFEIHNLRVEDSTHYIPLLEMDSTYLNTNALSTNSLNKLSSQIKSFKGTVTDEMLMGRKPSGDFSIQATGSGLVLVHGYCSSDVWGPVAGQFGGEIIFRDLDANRSHDDFARRVRDFGDANLNSYGIVAHSQGGAAALHLYTYYWSGLDNASGNRLIQSVGTPYQGTPLAGNLAAIGDIFGAGCGTNSNLTTSGAASWLAGVPTWARSQVYYSSTSFDTVWWRYDYCSIATDLFLSDPEDGVVEKSRAQLSSANNMGHKTGWCHTSDMRDPGQTTDSSRNSNMNANAKR